MYFLIFKKKRLFKKKRERDQPTDSHPPVLSLLLCCCLFGSLFSLQTHLPVAVFYATPFHLALSSTPSLSILFLLTFTDTQPFTKDSISHFASSSAYILQELVREAINIFFSHPTAHRPPTPVIRLIFESIPTSSVLFSFSSWLLSFICSSAK